MCARIILHNVAKALTLLSTDAQDAAAEKDAEPTDESMEVDGAATKTPRGNGFRLSRNVKQKEHKASRVGKSTHRKPRNNIVFKKAGRVKKGGK